MMKHMKPPITVASSKPITIENAHLHKRELFDRRTKETKSKSTIEAFVVNEPPKKGSKVLYSQTIDCDYVIQPKAMMSRGSMCVTELYGKNMRIKVVQTLIESKKKKDQIKKMRNQLFPPRKNTLSMMDENKFSPLARHTTNNPKFDRMRTQILTQPHLMSQQTLKQYQDGPTGFRRSSVSRYKMSKEDEKEFQEIVNDARKFLGKDALSQISPNKKDQIPLTLERKTLYEWIKQKRASYHSDKNKKKGKSKLLRQMTAESIDLPSESGSENEIDLRDPHLVHAQSQSHFIHLHRLAPQFSKSQKTLQFRPNILIQNYERDQGGGLQNDAYKQKNIDGRRGSKTVKFNFTAFDSKKNSAEPFIEEEELLREDQDFNDSQESDEKQHKQIMISPESIQTKKDIQRIKIMKLLSFQSPQQSNNTQLSSLESSRQYNQNSTQVSNFLTRQEKVNSDYKKKIADKAMENHNELVYYKKAGGLCLVNTVVPKKQKEGISIMKQKQVSESANEFMRIMAQLQSRKKLKLSKEAEKELEQSRGGVLGIGSGDKERGGGAKHQRNISNSGVKNRQQHL